MVYWSYPAGFVKGDYAPREGRKGRIVVDDPSKYPSREDFGPLLSVVGGWAGGEAALSKLKEEIKVQIIWLLGCVHGSFMPAVRGSDTRIVCLLTG